MLGIMSSILSADLKQHSRAAFLGLRQDGASPTIFRATFETSLYRFLKYNPAEAGLFATPRAKIRAFYDRLDEAARTTLAPTIAQYQTRLLMR